MDFKNALNDSVFAAENSDWGYRIISKEQKDSLSSPSVGDVSGPYFSFSYAMLYKVKGFDSCYMVRASHILLSVDNGNGSGKYNHAQAKKTADMLLKKINAGANFEALAKEYGCDGTAVRGGDLGWFKENVMVPDFNNACFKGKQDEVMIVETDFGFHVIKITGEKSKRRCGILVLPLVKNFKYK